MGYVVRTTGPERFGRGLACLSLLVTAAIPAVLLVEAAPLPGRVPLLELPPDGMRAPGGGLLPLAAGTLLVALVALAVALPGGLLCAVYLSEYAPAAARRATAPLLALLASVPTVVYGCFALQFVTPLLQRLLPGLAGVNALSPGLVAGVMILPMVAALAADALRGVPGVLREAAFALGATRAQAALRVVAPAARAGIAAAVLLAAGRAAGETMIAAVAAGRTPRLTANPLEPVETLAAYVVRAAAGGAPPDTPERQALFAVGLLLFTAIFGLNVAGNWLRPAGAAASRARAWQHERGRQLVAPVAPTAAGGVPVRRRRPGALAADRMLHAAGLAVTLGCAAAGGALLVDALASGVGGLSWPLPPGLAGALLGSVWTAGLAAGLAVPIGVGAGICLEEYADHRGRLARIVEINIASLAGVPAVVYGLLGLALFARAPTPGGRLAAGRGGAGAVRAAGRRAVDARGAARHGDAQRFVRPRRRPLADAAAPDAAGRPAGRPGRGAARRVARARGGCARCWSSARWPARRHPFRRCPRASSTRCRARTRSRPRARQPLSLCCWRSCCC